MNTNKWEILNRRTADRNGGQVGQKGGNGGRKTMLHGKRAAGYPGGKPPHSIQSPKEKPVPLGTLRRRKIQDFQEKL